MEKKLHLIFYLLASIEATDGTGGQIDRQIELPCLPISRPYWPVCLYIDTYMDSFGTAWTALNVICQPFPAS